MKTILENSICDVLMTITFLSALLSTLILDIKFFIKNKGHKLILEKTRSLYTILCIFFIPTIIIQYIYSIIKSSKYYNMFFILFIIIFSGYYIYKLIKLNSKKEFEKVSFSSTDRYNLILSQFFYFIIFIQPVYLQIVNNLNSFPNKFISNSILLFYMTLKLISFTYYLTINTLLIIKNLYKIIFPNLYKKILTFKSVIRNFEPLLNLDKDKPSLTFSKIDSSNFSHIIMNGIKKNYQKKCLYFYLKIPVIISIFYIFQFLKSTFLLVLSILTFPLDILSKNFKNEFIFFYKLLHLCIFISISSIFIHVLHHDIFNTNSVKLFEFFGITISVSIVLEQLKEISNKFNKESKQNQKDNAI